MSMNEGAINAPDVSSSPIQTSTSEVATPSVAPDTTSAPQGQPAGNVPAEAVQDKPTQDIDPFAELPSVEELNTQAAQGVKYAKALAELRGYAEPIRNQFTELQERHKVFENFQEKFSAPEEIQSLVDMRESLLGWEQGPNGLVPSTQKFIETLDRGRADYLFADLLDGKTTDPRNGQEISRVDRALQFVSADPERRANALKILGAVEPSAVAPQWQPTEEQLNAIPIDPANPTPQDKELQEIFRSLPYDEREQLATNEPDFIRRQLGREKLTRQLEADKQQTTQREQQGVQQREQMLQQEASRAGDAYVDKLLLDGLTTFHNSVVEQCDFIQPLDPQNLPQGMTAEQATQMNAQIVEANKAEAAQITAQIVALINPQTRRYMLPTLKETGVVDDKMMEMIDKAAEAIGNNGRNYGNLTYRGKLTANGNGYQPGADVVPLDTEAQRSFKLLVSYANQIKGKLMERRSQFFSMKATGHNSILNGAATTRPSANGSNFDPTGAATQQPTKWLSRDEIAQQFTR